MKNDGDMAFGVSSKQGTQNLSLLLIIYRKKKNLSSDIKSLAYTALACLLLWSQGPRIPISGIIPFIQKCEVLRQTVP